MLQNSHGFCYKLLWIFKMFKYLTCNYIIKIELTKIYLIKITNEVEYLRMLFLHFFNRLLRIVHSPYFGLGILLLSYYWNQRIQTTKINQFATLVSTKQFLPASDIKFIWIATTTNSIYPRILFWSIDVYRIQPFHFLNIDLTIFFMVI